MDTQKVTQRMNNLKASFLQDYDISLQNKDIYIASKVIYISSKKVAQLFRTSYHNFSNEYVQPLLKSGVRRVILGRHKFYCMSEVIDRLKLATTQDKSILDVCKSMRKKRKKNG